VSPLLVESTQCPLPLLGCLHARTFLRRLCVDYLSSCRLRVNCLSYCQLYRPATSITKALSTFEVSSTIQPRTACLLSFRRDYSTPYHLCVDYLFRIDHSTFSRLCVDYSFVSTTSPRVNYSLCQHLLEMQCAVQNIFNERVMDRGYLGDVGRRTVMRLGTVDPKRPAVAIWAMHPRSLDSSWRG